jgi:hypothetical protein
LLTSRSDVILNNIFIFEISIFSNWVLLFDKYIINKPIIRMKMKLVGELKQNSLFNWMVAAH